MKGQGGGQAKNSRMENGHTKRYVALGLHPPLGREGEDSSLKKPEWPSGKGPYMLRTENPPKKQ